MPSSFHLVIFDCDGVLVDSERLAMRVEAEALTRLGWPLSEEEIIDRFVGRSHEYMAEQIEARIGRSLDPDWEASLQRLYQEAFEKELRAVDGIEEVLEALTIPHCVASSNTHARIRDVLMLAGLYPRFEGRNFSVEDVERGKPEPDLFLHAARRMGVDASSCAVVDDSVAGSRLAEPPG